MWQGKKLIYSAFRQQGQEEQLRKIHICEHLAGCYIRKSSTCLFCNHF